MTRDTATTKRRRGRPANAALWMSVDAVADVLGLEVTVLERMLDAAPGVIPGAVREVDGWQIPERGLRSILGAPTGPLPVTCTVEQLAAWAQRSPKTVWEWLTIRGSDGKLVLPHRKLNGVILIDAAAVLRLPERLPSARPSSFFSERGKKLKKGVKNG